MSRLTEKYLRDQVDSWNRHTLNTSKWRLHVQNRNGYTAVDLYKIGEDGREHSHDSVETGSPRECYNAALRLVIDIARDQKLADTIELVETGANRECILTRLQSLKKDF